MKSASPLAAALLALLAGAGVAHAQVLQSGTITNGHIAKWETNGVIGDGGPATNGTITNLGILGTGTPFCINDAPITSPSGYHQLCFGAFSLGGGLLSYNAYGGATPLPLQIYQNGDLIPASPVTAAWAGFGYTVAPTPSQVFVSLGLGTIATQAANLVAITGGTVDGTAIGSTTPAAGGFSSLKDTGIAGSTQCLQASSVGVLSGTGSACGNGSGTVNSGTSGQLATYAATGTAVSGTSSISGISVSGAAGSFTTLAASSTVSGVGFSTYLASPPAIGGTAAAAGAFTTLSASSTVSGAGFSTYLASPPAIGGTTPAAGNFTTLAASGAITPSQTAGIVGTTTNNNANAGSVGEVVSGAGTPTNMTSGSFTTLVTFSLTPGDWDVQGWGDLTCSGNVITNADVGISPTPATQAPAGDYSQINFPGTSTLAAFVAPTPLVRLQPTTTTTYYGTGLVTCAAGTLTGQVNYFARRMR